MESPCFKFGGWTETLVLAAAQMAHGATQLKETAHIQRGYSWLSLNIIFATKMPNLGTSGE